ncbi:MAG: relaxase domain-containing protein [Acidimicrobiia bacterium]|nr:relaxase domain-containing protein [Acidimicrobiia bacterium]
MMRVTTLKATAAKLPGLLAYYAGLAEDRGQPGVGCGPVDYYLDPDEPPGRWRGAGRAALGLESTVAGSELRALLEGRHPVTGDPLGRQFGHRSARAFDATFSAPKSVSVLWALTPDPSARAEVLAAHDAAIDAALGWFERHGAVTRRGTDGVWQVDTGGITAAVFRQHTSRTMDPQLHSHAIIAAKVQDLTGRWLSLDARFLKYQQRSIGWIYDAALRTELTTRLGVGWIDRGDGMFDLACIPEPVRDAFSNRTHQVDAKLAELVRNWADTHGDADPDPRTIARLERDAVLDSRPDKVHGLDAAELHQRWATEARDVGFDPGRLVPKRIGAHGSVGREVDEDLIDEALLHATEESATWLRADLARHLSTLVTPDHAGTAEQLVAEIDRLAALAEKRCVPLGPNHRARTPRRRDGRPVTEAVTDRHSTTRTVLNEEHLLQAWATARTRPVEAGDDPQHAAADAIAGHDPLVLLVGPAGTGKTHTTARAVEQLTAAGRPVVGLAPSGKAADVLAREALCPTDTLAGFLTRHHHQPSPWPAGTTVILDETAMTATADLAALTRLVDAHRWRLVAVGDPDQLPAVGRGGVFAHWCDTLPHHTLETPAGSPNHGKPPPASPSAPETLTPSTRIRARPPPHIASRARRHPSRPRLPRPHESRTDRRDHHHQRRCRPDHQPGDPTPPQSPRTARPAPRRDHRPRRRPDRDPPQRPPTPHHHRGTGSEPAHLDRHRHPRRPKAHRRAPGPWHGRPPGRVRRRTRRARLGRHRLRHPRRHRRHRHRRPRPHHQPQPRLRRAHPRPDRQPRRPHRPLQHREPGRPTRPDHHPARPRRLRPHHPSPPPPRLRPRPTCRRPTRPGGADRPGRTERTATRRRVPGQDRRANRRLDHLQHRAPARAGPSRGF